MTIWVCFRCQGEVKKIKVMVFSILTQLPLEITIYSCQKCGTHNHKEQLMYKWISRWEKYNWKPAQIFQSPTMQSPAPLKAQGIGTGYFMFVHGRYQRHEKIK